MIIQGEIVSIKRDGEFGVEVGTIRCPKCGYEVKIKPFQSQDPKCLCGLSWYFVVKAEGEYENA